MATLEDLEATFAVALPHEALEALPSTLTLRVLDGEDRGKVFTVGGPIITGGRRPERQGEGPIHAITLTDRTVSLSHFELRRVSKGFLLRDLGSTNGTWVGPNLLPATSEGIIVFPGIREESGSTFRAGSVLLELVTAGKQLRAVSKRDGLGLLRGSSSPMRQLYSLLERISPKPIDVLVYGETGTGKGAVARTIHDLSGRTGRFVKLDGTHLNRELAEAMIMGHCKGTFKGALADRVGFVEEANGGTLFIDEIGELSWELQAKLLRVIDDKEVVRVGETKPRKVDVRIICATNRNLHKDVAEGRFRSDLFHRISTVPIELVPLRYRKEDIPQLAAHFLVQESRRFGFSRTFSEDALKALKQLKWEGNARQLKGVVQFAAAMADTEMICAADLRRIEHEWISMTDTDSVESSEPMEMTLKQAKAHFVRIYCAAVMRKYGGNVAMAAEHAGYSIKGFRELLLRTATAEADEEEKGQR